MADTTETGYAKPVGFSRITETNFELKWPQSVRQYARMVREDAQVKSLIKGVTLPPQRTTWRVDPAGASDEAVRLVAEDLRLPVLGDDGGQPLPSTGGHVAWQEHLYWALQSLTYGVMFFEKVYKVVGGRDRLWKLAPRMPDTISKINIADDGGLESIEQNPPPGAKNPKPIVIPVERLLVYVHDPVVQDWTGTSMLRPAYKHWVLKDQLMRLEAQVLERNGMGVPVYTTADPQDRDELDRGAKLASGLRAGSEAGASIPFGANLEIAGTKGQLVSPREAIDFHNREITKAGLAHVLNLDGKGGSYALAETQLDMFVQSLQTIGEQIATVANKYLIEEMVDIAFDTTGGPYPRLVFDPIGSKKELTAESLSILTNSGVILPDKDLEEEVRRRYSLPPKRPFDPPNQTEDT